MTSDHVVGKRTPIAVFAFNRPRHLQRALSSLARCACLDECNVYIYCDGPRRQEDLPSVEATRQVAEAWATRQPAVVSRRDNNLGLARSIVEGVTDLCARYGRVIVLEDDLVVSPDFVHYMLCSLDRYHDEHSVYQIAGHMHPIAHPESPDAFFLPRIESWGWATWERAWKAFDWQAPGSSVVFTDSTLRRRFDLDGSYPYSTMLRDRTSGRNDSWGILWYWAVFQAQGLVLYPRRSLVWNGGWDGSGVHCGKVSGYQDQPPVNLLQVALPTDLRFPEQIQADGDSFRRLVAYFNRQQPALAARMIARIASWLLVKQNVGRAVHLLSRLDLLPRLSRGR